MKRSTLSSMVSLVTAAVLFLPLGSSIALASDDPQQPAVRSTLAPQQLDNLVAPLALYPDPLLSQVLVASTYPLEVVEAYQWLQQNRSLTGTALMDAAKTQNWDPSVQALVAFPDVLTRLNQDVRWTTDLGNAFLGQQPDVMAAVQRLRARAQANGKLQTTPQETVTTQDQNGQAAISIQPADPQVIYVPTYDPTYVWGAPAYGYYPSLFYPSYGFGFGFGIPIGGFFAGWPGWGFGFGWGWGFNWFGGGLFVNSGFFNHYGYHLGGAGFRGGFAGNRAWAHDNARTARAGGAGGYSRSYNSPASSFRGGANSFANRAGSNSFANRAGANSYANRAGANSFANRAGSNAYANRGYSAGAARSYSPRSYSNGYAAGRSAAPSRSYSAPSRSYSSGGASRSFSGGGSRSFGGGGSRGGGGGHGGGRR